VDDHYSFSRDDRDLIIFTLLIEDSLAIIQFLDANAFIPAVELA
jgi:hypothetical protein